MLEPEGKYLRRGWAADIGEETIVNLPANADVQLQRQVLDALPALVFLERQGKIVFANAEARQIMGLTEGEWAPHPIEEVLWGLFPARPSRRQCLPARAAAVPFMPPCP